MRGRIAGYLLAGSALFGWGYARAEPIFINEMVVDPKFDYDGSGSITPSDEFFEIYNAGSSPVNLDGWRMELIDSTPASASLEGIIGAGEYLVKINPPGAQNDNGRVELYDFNSLLVDAVSHGNWNDGNVLDNAPSGNANSLLDESLSRYPDGGSNFVKTRATPGAINVPEPMSGVILSGGIALLSAINSRCRKR